MNNLDILKQDKINLHPDNFNVSSFNKAVNEIFLGSSLYKRNLFLFKDGKSSPIDELKSFDLNFSTLPLAEPEIVKKFLKEGYSFQIRGLQSLGNFFYDRSVKEFKKTFCLNNYNLYLSPANTNAFKRHKDPYNSIIYFLKGSKIWHFDEDSLNTESGDLLFIPSKTYHNVESLSASLHITSSYYSLPIIHNAKKESVDIPILAQIDKADAIYDSMKSFFKKNMNVTISMLSIFNDLSYLKSHYMFFHLSKPFIYIQGIGELIFKDNNEKEQYWKLLHSDIYQNDFIKELRERIAKVKS